MGWKSGALLVLCTAVAVLWLPSLFQSRRFVTVGGFVKPGWEKVEEAFKKCLESGAHLGGSFAVYHRGEPVVHLYGGAADQEASVPWRKDTFSPLFSTSKGIGSILIALLVDRGLLEYDQPVAKYWPEFAQNGKGKITVKQILSHQAGLITFDEPVSIYSIQSHPDEVIAQAAASTPHWKPGEGFGYHAMTFGVFVDALIRRVDLQHRNISQFYEDEIRKPYDVDFHIGLPRLEHYRTARFYPLSRSPFRMISQLLKNIEIIGLMVPYLLGMNENFMGKAMTALNGPDKDEFNINIPLMREVPLVSCNGFGTAEGVAKIWGILANNGRMYERTLIKPKTAKLLAEPVVSGIDKCMTVNMTYGPGTLLLPSHEGTFQAGHPGLGGQMGYMDLKHQLGWAYITNYEMIGHLHETYAAVTAAMYESISKIE